MKPIYHILMLMLLLLACCMVSCSNHKQQETLNRAESLLQKKTLMQFFRILPENRLLSFVMNLETNYQRTIALYV